jgi:hypothetical protein
MSTDPDQIRQNIEHTQSEMGGDVDALTGRAGAMADRYDPGKAAGRRADRISDAVHQGRDRVMGTAGSVGQTANDKAGQARDRASHAASEARQTISSAPQAARERAEGSPLAAGLIAFGAGILVSSLLPASEPERRAAGRVKNLASQHSDQVKQGLRGAGQQLREGLREPTRHAAESVKSRAGQAASSVRDEGQWAARDVKDHAQQAGQNVGSQQR